MLHEWRYVYEQCLFRHWWQQMIGRRLPAMAELVLLATIVVIALLAPVFGVDSRDLPGRGNRGHHPTSPDSWWDFQRFMRH